jgi:hypothetical protein
MCCKATCYRLASVATLVVGSLWAVSQGASADTVTITNQVFTGNAPLADVASPVSSLGNFIQSVTGGDTPAPSGKGTGGRLSPYAFNTDGLQDTGEYSVLGAGPPSNGMSFGAATYNINAPAAELLWGSPDTYNQVTFFAGPDGTGTVLNAFNGSNLACFTSTCNQTGFDLVTFTDPSGTIGSMTLTNATPPAFEFGGPAPIPLPPAIYLFGSVLGGALWLGRRKRGAVSGLGAGIGPTLIAC